MSGPENIRGIDYQVACTLLRLLKALIDNGLEKALFESLDDENEDFSLFFKLSPVLHVQIKKRAEGVLFTPTMLRTQLERLAARGSDNQLEIITNIPANPKLKALIKALEADERVDAETLQAAMPRSATLAEARELIGRAVIRTRYYSSSDDSKPGEMVMAEVERVLATDPFALTRSPSSVSVLLWKQVFDWCRAGSGVTKEDILECFRTCGLRLDLQRWAQYPQISDFYGRDKAILDILGALSGRCHFLFGIGGIGKTSLAAEIAASATKDGVDTFWMSLSALSTLEHTSQELHRFLRHCGIVVSPESESSPRQLLRELASALGHNRVVLVFDGLEHAVPALWEFIRTLVDGCLKSHPSGGLLMTSRMLPEWYSQADLASGKVVEVSVDGLDLQSARRLIGSSGRDFTEENVREFHKAIGGHPQSLRLLAEMGSLDRAKPEQGVKQTLGAGLEASRDWLIGQVITELDQRTQRALLSLSVFEGPFSDELVLGALDSVSRLDLRTLVRRHLIQGSEGDLRVHDTIREVAYEMLSLHERDSLHRAVAKQLLSIMTSVHDAGEGVLYEDAFQWLYHLERISTLSTEDPQRFSLLHEEERRLAGLFAIARLGFPYCFDDPSLDEAWALVDELVEDGLVSQVDGEDRTGPWGLPAMFQLSGLSFFDSLLISVICLTRGYCNHLGYLDIHKPNYAGAIQGLACPWEHCIELYPLPPITKKAFEESVQRARKQLLAAEELGLSEAEVEGLEAELQREVPPWAVDEPDLELEARSCFLFGHACPGGPDQAQHCRRLDRFEWIEEPQRPPTEDRE